MDDAGSARIAAVTVTRNPTRHVRKIHLLTLGHRNATRGSRWAATGPPGARTVDLLRDPELAEVELVGPDVLRLRDSGQPLLGHDPVLVVTEVQVAAAGGVPLGGLDVERVVTGGDGLVQHRVDSRVVT